MTAEPPANPSGGPQAIVETLFHLLTFLDDIDDELVAVFLDEAEDADLGHVVEVVDWVFALMSFYEKVANQ